MGWGNAFNEIICVEKFEDVVAVKKDVFFYRCRCNLGMWEDTLTKVKMGSVFIFHVNLSNQTFVCAAFSVD